MPNRVTTSMTFRMASRLGAPPSFPRRPTTFGSLNTADPSCVSLARAGTAG